MLAHCPKCGHAPLPVDQSLPTACPACGVILAKVAAAASPIGAGGPARPARAASGHGGLPGWLLQVPDRVDPFGFWMRVALWAAFAVWGVRLIRLDYRTGEINESFLHAPLLVFHEAGHVLFRLFGEWLMVLGGTLGQLLMPAVLAGALLWKNRDPFGAAIALWLFAVSVLDVAPYMYDALDPQLMLLSGATGEAGGHDWIYLFSSLHWLPRAQAIGAATHAAGAVLLVCAVAWAGWVLTLQRARLVGGVLTPP